MSFVVQKDHEDSVKIQSLLIRDTSFTRNIYLSQAQKKQLNTKTSKNTKTSHLEERELPGIRSLRGHTEVLNEVRGIARQGGNRFPQKTPKLLTDRCIAPRDLMKPSDECVFFQKGGGSLGLNAECLVTKKIEF